MNSSNNIYDIVEEAESRVAFINHAVNCIGAHDASGDNLAMSKTAWSGLFFMTLDIMTMLDKAKKLYES